MNDSFLRCYRKTLYILQGTKEIPKRGDGPEQRNERGAELSSMTTATTESDRPESYVHVFRGHAVQYHS